MQKRNFLAKLLILLLSTIVFSSSVAAIDLNFNPELDAPKGGESALQTTGRSDASKRLPGERESNNTISTQPLFLTNNKQDHDTEPGNGWVVKAPSISSDKEPDITDERQSVKMSEQQMWQEGGKNYDNNPLNKDNYRINVEAEYTF